MNLQTYIEITYTIAVYKRYFILSLCTTCHFYDVNELFNEIVWTADLFTASRRKNTERNDS